MTLQSRALLPIPAPIQAAFREADRYFTSPIQKFQFFDKYSRFDPSLGRRETWIETVNRAVGFLQELVVTNTNQDLGEGFYHRLRQAILTMRSMPSMRLLSMAGPAARRDNTTIFNCSYLPVDRLESFCEALLISMAGCGVGFSVERRYTEHLPIIAPQWGEALRHYQVADSAEGWAAALRTGLHTWAAGDDIQFDYSLLRPAGAPLRIKGGQASGPEPFRQLLDFARQRLLSAQGRRLEPIEAHDLMCVVGNAAISGGVRRTAMLSLFDPEDEAMRRCKSGDFEVQNQQRWNANNSAVWPTAGLPRALAELLLDEMIESQRGEPGIVNRQALNLLPERRKRFGRTDYGVNPCFAPGTLIQTSTGHFPIEQLVGKEVAIWEGSTWQAVDNFRVTAQQQPVLKVTLQDGSMLRVTPYHQMILESGERVLAEDLLAGDRLARSEAPYSHGSVRLTTAYAKGFLVAEGTVRDELPALDVYPPKHGCLPRLIESFAETPGEASFVHSLQSIAIRDADSQGRHTVQGLSARRAALLPWVTDCRQGLPKEAFAWDQPSKAAFLAGLFDGDGTVIDTDHAFGYQLSSIRQQLLLDVQALLKTMGVRSKVTLSKQEGLTKWPDGRTYFSQTLWRLTIAQESSVAFAQQVHFGRLISFADRQVKYRMKPRFNAVVSVEPDGIEEEVYCCTVEGTHSLALTQGIQVGQCSEIFLRPRQFCNLSIAVARSDDTFESLRDKVEVATLIGTIQSLATAFPNLDPIWKQNCDEERLLGVDITGQMDCPLTADPLVMQRLREHAVETNRLFAARLGIPQSSAVTCVKPSGNSAQLLDCSSGLHPRWAPYYIRNARVSAKSPIFRVLQAAGVPMDPENGQQAPTALTWVVHFPVAAPEGAITRKDRTAIEQCDYWLHNKLHWTEHNPSVTITYEPQEVPLLKQWIWEHRRLIGGMAFLPSFDAQYDQMPYEEITQEAYERLIAAFPVVDYAQLFLYEGEDHTTISQELSCSSGSCEI